MKKVIFVLAVGFLFTGASQASAAECGNTALNHAAITTTDPITLEVTVVSPAVAFVNCGNGSPEMVMNAWGTTNSQITHINPGTQVLYRTAWGAVIDLGCPLWFRQYCVDITETQYWKDRWGQGLVKI